MPPRIYFDGRCNLFTALAHRPHNLSTAAPSVLPFLGRLLTWPSADGHCATVYRPVGAFFVGNIKRGAMSSSKHEIKPLRKLFISNRGEIAERITRCCERLGLPCVTAHIPSEEGRPYVVRSVHSVLVSPTDFLSPDAMVRAAVCFFLSHSFKTLLLLLLYSDLFYFRKGRKWL